MEKVLLMQTFEQIYPNVLNSVLRTVWLTDIHGYYYKDKTPQHWWRTEGRMTQKS